MKNELIEELFSKYEKASSGLNLEEITDLYADTFISAGPKGIIAQNKKEFEQKAEQAIEFYRSAGQNSMRIISKKIIPVSDDYSMVTVLWGATFGKTADRVIEFDVSYIVQHTGNDPKIILFITHQDEEESMRELGLQPELHH